MTIDTITVKRAKRMARTLQDTLKASRPKGYSDCLEAVAGMLGYSSFNALQAALPQTDADTPAPGGTLGAISADDLLAEIERRGLSMRGQLDAAEPHVATPAPPEILQPLSAAPAGPSYDALHAAVQKIARMTGDGEELGDGVYYEMSIDDAFENLAEVIDLCRTTLKAPQPGNPKPAAGTPTGVTLLDAEAPGIEAAVTQVFGALHNPAAVEIRPMGVDALFGDPTSGIVFEAFDFDELDGDARRIERDFETLTTALGVAPRLAIGVRETAIDAFRVYLLDDPRAPTRVWVIADPSRVSFSPAAAWSALETHVAPLLKLDLQHLQTA